MQAGIRSAQADDMMESIKTIQNELIACDSGPRYHLREPFTRQRLPGRILATGERLSFSGLYSPRCPSLACFVLAESLVLEILCGAMTQYWRLKAVFCYCKVALHGHRCAYRVQ